MPVLVAPYAHAEPAHERNHRMNTPRHVPVMVEEVLQYLLHERTRTVLDGTVGFGGHAEAILSARADVSVVGVDRDPVALAAAGERLGAFGDRVQLVPGLYSDLDAALARTGRVDGILLDLGISSAQIDEAGRGFAHAAAGPLDMRMDHRGPTAAELIAGAGVEEIAGWLRGYGEVRHARRVARAIRAAADRGQMTSTAELRAAVVEALGRGAAPAELSRVFQGLRIAVNRELEHLRVFLDRALDHLNPFGRLVVLSYHSLEDRMVKEFLRDASAHCVCPPSLPVCVCGRTPRVRMLTRRALGPRQEEVRRNPRARSARLRAAEKIDGQTS